MKLISRKQFLKSIGVMGAAAAVIPDALATSDLVVKTNIVPERIIKVGIIGCGSVFRYYLAHLNKSPYADIVCLCDIIPDRAKQRAVEYNVDHWYPNIDEMLRGVPFDLFVNLTDMQEHTLLNRKAILSGKHIFSEKPLANTYKEGKELTDLAKRMGIRVWGAPVVVNSPQFAFMAREIIGGKLGRISAGHGCYGHLGPSWSSFFYEKLGGSIPDLGVYNIATLTGLLGPATTVMAMTNIISPTRNITGKGTIQVEEEDNAHILFEHQNGSISHIQCGFNYTMAHSYESDEISTLSIIGNGARMDMIGYDWAPLSVDMATPGSRKMQRMATDRATYVWEEGASAACESLSTGKEPLFTAEHALHVLEIIESARKSQKTGRRIKLKSSFKYPVL